ncbi:MAG: hypothetical protein ACFE9Z_17645, partial [Promethearchaeota archaeon]
INITNGISQLFDLDIWDNLLDEQQFTVNIFANDTFGYVNNTLKLVLHKDVVIPTLEINSPGNNTYWNEAPNIQVTVSDLYYHSVWYIVGGIKVMLTNGATESLNSSIWNNLPDENSFTIYFYANDSAGNINNTCSLCLHKDILAPRFSISFPENNDLFGNTAPNYSLYINELYVDDIWYTLDDGVTNFSITEISGTINQTAWESFLDGPVSIKFYVNDTIGYLSFDEIIVQKDVTAPIITINLPNKIEIYGFMAPNFNIYKDGSDINMTWYTLNNGNTNFTFTGLTGVINQSAWEFFLNGTVTIRFYINDSLNNIGYDEVIVWKDIIAPTLNVNSPIFNNTWIKNPPKLNISSFDPNLIGLWYRAGSTNVNLTNNIEQSLDTSIWKGLPQGEFKIYFYAIDAAGNINETFITLFKDTLRPVIIVNSPGNCTYWNDILSINVTVYDLTFVGDIQYEVLQFGISMHLPEILENNTKEDLLSDIWDDLEDGEFLIRIWCRDYFSNTSISRLILYKDTTAPTININSPTNTYFNSPPSINITVFDQQLNKSWYRINSSKGWSQIIFLENNSNQFLDEDIWNGLDQGFFQIYFYANDSFGYLNNSYFLTLYKDTIIPILVIDTPLGKIFFNSEPDIQVTVYDTNFDSVWCYVDGTKVMLTNSTSKTLNSSIWDSLPDENSFIIYFYANDSAGNENSSIFLTLYKDTIIPMISIDLPSTINYWNEVPDIQVTVSDAYFDSVWYIVGGTKIKLFNGISEPLHSSIWDSLLDESSFTIYFYANDSAGNVNSSIYLTLYKDIITPSILISSPGNNTYWNEPPDIQATVYDTYNDSVWCFIGGTKVMLINGVSKTLNSSIWDNIPDESSFTIYFYANDSAGNVNSSIYLTLYKDIIAPSISISSPGNNTYWNEPPDIQVCAFDTNFDSVWYIVDGIKIMLVNGTSEPLNSSIWDGLPVECSITIYFFANDTLGNNVSQELIIHKDTHPPEINIILPVADTVIGRDSPYFNVSIAGSDIQNQWYILINATEPLKRTGKNFFMGNYGWISLLDWYKFKSGLVIIRFYANDSLGNIGYDEILVEKDIIAPDILIQVPSTDFEVFGQNAPSYIVSKSGSDIDKTWYVLGTSNYSSEEYIFTGDSGIIDQIIWNNIEPGIFYIYFYINDTVGNINVDWILLIKDISPPKVCINSPLDNTYWNNPPPINVSAYDLDLALIWYRINSSRGWSEIIFLENNSNQFLGNIIWDNL